MSDDSDLQFLRTAPEGERWVWLAGKFSKLREDLANDYGRLNAHDRQLDVIQVRCAGRSWHRAAICWLLGLAAAGGGGVVCYIAYLAGRHIFGGG